MYLQTKERLLSQGIYWTDDYLDYLEEDHATLLDYDSFACQVIAHSWYAVTGYSGDMEL